MALPNNNNKVNSSSVPNQGNLSGVIQAIIEYNDIIDIILGSALYNSKLSLIQIRGIQRQYKLWGEVIEDIINNITELSNIDVGISTKAVTVVISTYSNIILSLVKLVDKFGEATKGKKLVAIVQRIDKFVQTSLGVFIGLNDSLEQIFSSAFKLAGLAWLAQKLNVWTAIRRGIIGYNNVLKEISFSNTLQELGKLSLKRYTGIELGSKGKKVSNEAKMFQTLESTFLAAVVAGRLAKRANKYWDDLAEGIMGYKMVLGVLAKGAASDAGASGGLLGILNDDTGGSEESITSVLKDKYFGINEIALLEFNTELLSILPKTFFWAIVAGNVAKIANKQRVWQSLATGIRHYKEVMALFNEELLITALVVQKFNLDRVKIVKEDAVIVGLLSITFTELIILSKVARLLKANDIKQIAIGMGMLLIISAGMSLIALMFKVGSIVLAAVKLVILMPLLAVIFLELLVVALVALPASFLWKPILIGMGVLTGLVVAMFIISKLMENSSIVLTAFKLVIVLALLLVVFTELIALGLIIVVALIPMAAVAIGLIALGIIVYLMNIIIVPKGMAKKFFRLGLAILELIIIAGELLLLSIVMSHVKFKDLLFDLLAMIGIIAVIGLVFAATIFLAPVFFISSIAVILMLSMVTMILLIAGILRLLQMIKLNKDLIINNVNTVTECIGAVVGEVKKDKPDGLPEIDLGLWRKDKLFAIMKAIPILATSVIVFGLIFILILELKVIEKIPLERDVIIANVQAVMDTIHEILDSLFQKADVTEVQEDDPWYKKLGKDVVNWIANSMSASYAIITMLMSVPMLLMALISVACIWGIASILTKIQELKINRDDVKEAAKKIIGCANDIKDIVLGKEEKKEETKEKAWYEKAWDGIKEGAKTGWNWVSGTATGLLTDSLLGVTLLAVTELWGVAEVIQKIKEFNAKPEEVKAKATDIMSIANFVCSQVNSKPNVSTLDPYKVDKFKVFADDSIRVMKEINKLDADKLVKYSDMWAKMTEFMQEIKDLNIEELSDAIVNKIAPAMSDISDNVDSMSKAKPNSEAQITNPPADKGKPVVAADTKIEGDKNSKAASTDKILEDIRNLLVDYFESRG